MRRGQPFTRQVSFHLTRTVSDESDLSTIISEQEEEESVISSNSGSHRGAADPMGDIQPSPIPMIPRPRLAGVRENGLGQEGIHDISRSTVGSASGHESAVKGRHEERGRYESHGRTPAGMGAMSLIPPEVVTGIPPKPDYDTGQSDPLPPKRKGGVDKHIVAPVVSTRHDDDLSRLTSLDAGSIRDALVERYSHNIIHTFIGDILVVINPYRDVGIYGPEFKSQYSAVVPHGSSSSPPPPHVYWTAALAYRNLMIQRRNQCICVSGESGAGKTESTKYLVEQLIHVCRCKSPETEDLHNRIVKVNPLLEAFGNASTCMNKNSSRFGKYIEVFFTAEGKLTGGIINDYLLERSRVVQQGEGERNFHVFYYLFAGMSPDKLMYYCDSGPEHFRILSQEDEKKTVYKNQDDFDHCAMMFHDMVSILETVGFEDDDARDGIWGMLFAILYISNIRFEYNDEDGEGEIVNDDEVMKVSELLDVKLEDLITHLLCMYSVAGGEEVYFMRTHEQAIATRDALAKELYGRLFGWIVKRINKTLVSGPQGNFSIGILDMAGFENFSNNSFEQFCINIANERLHTFFNEHVLAEEQRQYEEEGVKWRTIPFSSNEDLLNVLIDKKGNMLLHLDEQSFFPRATDRTLVETWSHEHKDKDKLARFDERSLQFSICHYADDVTYNAEHFLSKNRDRLDANLKKAMTESLNVFVKDLFSATETELGSISRTPTEIRTQSVIGKIDARNMMRTQRTVSKDTMRKLSKKTRPGLMNNHVVKKQKTMSQQFRASLQDLMTKMSKADPLFVRCVKPNSRQMGGQIDEKLLMRQLQYSGVLEVAKIRKLGFPIRMPHKQFAEKYSLAVFPASKLPPATVATCHDILNKSRIPGEDWLVGKSKVFMKDKAAEHITKLTHDKAAVCIQSGLKTYIARRNFKLQRMDLIERRRREDERRQREEEERKRREREQPDSGVSNGQSSDNFSTGATASTSLHGSDNGRAHSIVEYPLPPIPGSSSSATAHPIDITTSHPLNAEKEEPSEDPPEEPPEEESDEDDFEFAEGDKPIWDMFQLIPRDRISPSESFEGMLKGLRLFMYVFLFLAVWISSTASVGGFLLLVGAASKGYATSKENKASRELTRNIEAQLLYILIFPLVITAIISMFKVLFGNFPWPSAKLWMAILTIELLHTVGVTILVYRVFMYFGAIYSLGIMNSICFVPSLLRLLFMKRDTKGAKQKATCTLLVFLDLIAFLLQGCAVALPIVVRHFRLGAYYWASDFDKDESTKLVGMPGSQQDVHMYWQVPVGIVLTSIKWWENFVDVNRGSVKLFDLKRAFHNTRMTANCVTSLLKIGVIVAIYYILLVIEDEDLTLNNFKPITDDKAATNSSGLNDTANWTGEQIVLSLTPCILQILGSLICYFFAVLACKLRMQQWSFSLALSLASPTVAIVIILQCIDIIPELPAFRSIQFEFLCDYGGVGQFPYYPAAAAIWWVSFLWVTRYIWFPKADRLAQTEALFVTHLYNGPLIIQSMLLNRRSNDDSLLRVEGGEQIYETMGLQGTLPQSSSSTTGDNLAANPNMAAGSEAGGEGSVAGTARGGTGGRNRSRPIPIIYACATMWHETRNEMMQLLKSIFRMDADQATRRIAQEEFNIIDPDYYEFEANIFFDDVMEQDEKEKWCVNKFVKLFLSTLNEAASSVLEIQKEMAPPTKIQTPYGGRLVWTLPGKNTLNVHLKDKNKIRHRKRWSQVMYMYYLLGFRLVEASNKFVWDMMRGNDGSEAGTLDTKAKTSKGISWLKSAVRKFHATEHFAKSKVFYELMSEPLVQQAENTYILALDGDVDFKPDAVKLLLDRMKINDKTGAVCGRIHPIGNGPIVWYQIFEYAVGHWFQKATEHVLGCVLCSPGCFSLFRGSALMDDNVMRKYTIKAEQPSDYLQFDQGEDRWLCTLLLQQGYRIDYAAASDALTYAPETFNEFFNQRRRWTPSTMANIIDLLSDASNTVRVNPNISFLYIFYQFFLMASTILGPATIVLAIASAFEQVLVIELWQAYLLSIGPCVFYIVICFKTKTNTQLLVASFLSTFYAAIMLVVLVGIIKAIGTQRILDPSLIFFVVVSISFIVAGCMHPYEFGCLTHGIVYFLCIPAGYLILMIYSLSNMHIVSWGTREVKKRLSPEQEAAAKAEADRLEAEKAKKKSSGFLAIFRSPDLVLQEIKTTLTDIFKSSKSQENNDDVVKLLRKMYVQQKNMNRALRNKDEWSDSDSETERKKKKEATSVPSTPTTPMTDTLMKKGKGKKEATPVLELSMPEDWINDEEVQGAEEPLDPLEQTFWENFIKRYLKPLKKDKKKEEELGNALIELRNNASFAFWLINGLWILFNFMISNDAELSSIPLLDLKVNPLGFIFLIFFMLILLLQMIGMMIHRWGTFLQLISITEIPNPFRRRNVERNLMDGGGRDPNISPKEAVEITRQLTKFEPAPDYSDSEGDEYEQLPEGEDNGINNNGVRRRKPWETEDPRRLIGTIRQKMSERPGYRYSPLPEEVLEQDRNQRLRPDGNKIDLHPLRHAEEERRRRYLRGGGKATISRNFTVNNEARRYYRDREQHRQQQHPIQPAGRRPTNPFPRRMSRRMSRPEHNPHRSEGWVPSRQTRYHDDDIDRQFHRRMHQYLASGGLPQQTRRY